MMMLERHETYMIILHDGKFEKKWDGLERERETKQKQKQKHSLSVKQSDM